MALRESTTVDECCNKIVESITNAPTSGQNGDICGETGAQTQFGDTLNFVNSAPLHKEIYEGTYIMLQTDPDFIYSCNGCIKSIQLAVTPTSILKNAQGQERIKFHTFTDKTGDRSIYQRREDVAVWNSSVVNTTVDRKVVDYRPIDSTELCFSQGDVFGFTIEAGSDITVLTRVPPDTRSVLNVSSTLESGCPQLSLYMTTGSLSTIPRIHIVTGKINFLLSFLSNVHYIMSYFAGGFPPTEPPMTTTEPSTTEFTSQAATRTTPDSAATPSNPNSTPSIGGVSPPGSEFIIYAAVGFGGAVCILLIIVIIVVVICIVQRRKHRSYEYGNGFKFGSPSELFMDTLAIY